MASAAGTGRRRLVDSSSGCCAPLYRLAPPPPRPGPHNQVTRKARSPRGGQPGGNGRAGRLLARADDAGLRRQAGRPAAAGLPVVLPIGRA